MMTTDQIGDAFKVRDAGGRIIAELELVQLIKHPEVLGAKPIKFVVVVLVLVVVMVMVRMMTVLLVVLLVMMVMVKKTSSLWLIVNQRQQWIGQII